MENEIYHNQLFGSPCGISFESLQQAQFADEPGDQEKICSNCDILIPIEMDICPYCDHKVKLGGDLDWLKADVTEFMQSRQTGDVYDMKNPYIAQIKDTVEEFKASSLQIEGNYNPANPYITKQLKEVIEEFKG